MSFRLAADFVLLLHLLFIMLALLGASVSLWWRWAPVVHVPVAIWATYVELTGSSCPLTRLEIFLRANAGQSGYTGSFIENYLLGTIYPAGLTREIQFMLAFVVIIVNIGIYGWLVIRKQYSHSKS